MSINLTKGQGICLTKGLSKVRFEISWDTSEDLDIQATVLKSGKATQDEDFIFYGNKTYPTGGVKLSGDSKTGVKVTDGADETIFVDLDLLEPNKDEVLLTVSINDAVQNGLHFGKIPNVIIKLINDVNGELLASYNVTNDLFGEVVGKIATIVKKDGSWKFNAIGTGLNSLESLLEEVGLTCC